MPSLPEKPSFQRGFIDLVSLFTLFVLVVGLVSGTILVSKRQELRKFAALPEEEAGPPPEEVQPPPPQEVQPPPPPEQPPPQENPPPAPPPTRECTNQDCGCEAGFRCAGEYPDCSCKAENTPYCADSLIGGPNKCPYGCNPSPQGGYCNPPPPPPAPEAPPPAPIEAPHCGDATCSSGEDCSTCPADCGQCPISTQPPGPLPGDYQSWRCPGPTCDRCGYLGWWASGCSDFCASHPGDAPCSKVTGPLTSCASFDRQCGPGEVGAKRCSIETGYKELSCGQDGCWSDTGGSCAPVVATTIQPTPISTPPEVVAQKPAVCNPEGTRCFNGFVLRCNAEGSGFISTGATCEVPQAPTAPTGSLALNYLNREKESDKFELVRDLYKKIPQEAAPTVNLEGTDRLLSQCQDSGIFLISGLCGIANPRPSEIKAPIAQDLEEQVKNGKLTVREAYLLAQKDPGVLAELSLPTTGDFVIDYVTRGNETRKFDLIKEGYKGLTKEVEYGISEGEQRSQWDRVMSGCADAGVLVVSGICQSLNPRQWGAGINVARGLGQEVKDGKITPTEAFELSNNDPFVKRELLLQGTYQSDLNPVEKGAVTTAAVVSSVISLGHSTSVPDYFKGQYEINKLVAQRTEAGQPVGKGEEYLQRALVSAPLGIEVATTVVGEHFTVRVARPFLAEVPVLRELDQLAIAADNKIALGVGRLLGKKEAPPVLVEKPTEVKFPAPEVAPRPKEVPVGAPATAPRSVQDLGQQLTGEIEAVREKLPAIGQVKEPPIKPGEVFDPEKEVRNILKVPTEERPQALVTFKEKLGYQRKGLVNLEEDIINTVKANPDTPVDELASKVSQYSKTYGFSKTQDDIALEGINIYSLKRARLKEIRAQYPDDTQLFKAMYGREPKGSIKIENGPINFIITVTNKEDAELAGAGLSAERYLGVVNPFSTKIPDTEGMVVTLNRSLSEEIPSNIVTHEQRHVYDNLFEELSLTIKPDELSTLTSQKTVGKETFAVGDVRRFINDYLGLVRRKIQLNAKGEILAYLEEGHSSSFILDDLSSVGTSHDYFIPKYQEYFRNTAREALPDYTKGVAGSYFDLSFRPDFERENLKKLVKEGLDSYELLISRGYSKDSALALLSKEPLTTWPRVVDRFSEPSLLESVGLHGPVVQKAQDGLNNVRDRVGQWFYDNFGFGGPGIIQRKPPGGVEFPAEPRIFSPKLAPLPANQLKNAAYVIVPGAFLVGTTAGVVERQTGVFGDSARATMDLLVQNGVLPEGNYIQRSLDFEKIQREVDARTGEDRQKYVNEVALPWLKANGAEFYAANFKNYNLAATLLRHFLYGKGDFDMTKDYKDSVVDYYHSYVKEKSSLSDDEILYDFLNNTFNYDFSYNRVENTLKVTSNKEAFQQAVLTSKPYHIKLTRQASASDFPSDPYPLVYSLNLYGIQLEGDVVKVSSNHSNPDLIDLTLRKNTKFTVFDTYDWEERIKLGGPTLTLRRLIGSFLESYGYKTEKDFLIATYGNPQDTFRILDDTQVKLDDSEMKSLVKNRFGQEFDVRAEYTVPKQFTISVSKKLFEGK